MRRRWLTGCAAVVMACALAGCGLGGQRHAVVIPSDAVPSGLLASAEPSTPQSTVLVPTSTMYLVNGTNLVAVHRPRTQTATLQGLITTLLKGPTDPESADGFSTAIDTSPTLLGVSIDSSELATINLSGSFGDIRGTEQVLATAQVVMTAVSFPGVTAVQISLDGVPTAVPLANGTLFSGPLRASDYASLLASR